MIPGLVHIHSYKGQKLVGALPLIVGTPYRFYGIDDWVVPLEEDEAEQH